MPVASAPSLLKSDCGVPKRVQLASAPSAFAAATCPADGATVAVRESKSSVAPSVACETTATVEPGTSSAATAAAAPRRLKARLGRRW